MKDLDKKIVCDCCGDEIAGFYEDNHDGSYTCLSCLIKMNEINNGMKYLITEDCIPFVPKTEKRRNKLDCQYWKPRGKTTHYCTIDENDPLKRCYGVCKKYKSKTI